MRMEENLREAACMGNIYTVKKLLQTGAKINAQNAVNGWTALHWACKRCHPEIVQYLIENGADSKVKTTKGEIPSDLTDNPIILSMLPCNALVQSSPQNLPIIPHYLQHPVFPYNNMIIKPHLENETSNKSTMIVKARIADGGETDFVEVEVEGGSYINLLQACCNELEVPLGEVVKIRKLPNILIRKDRDVVRLLEGQELELVLKSKP